jgi:RND family efflux transporter MFP subunit
LSAGGFFLVSVEEIEKSRLKAPFDATVTQRRVDEGQVVSAGSPILRLQENRAWEIRVGIAGRIVDSVEVGQVIPVVANHLSFDASVKAIVPVRDGRSRTVDVILSLAKVPSHVRSGDLIRVDLATTIEKSGYWIPLSALSEGARGLWSIYIMEQDSAHRSPARQTVRRRTIEIIHEESNRVFVQGDFENDDRFVTDGLQRIVPGQLVQVSRSLARLNESLD